MPLSFRRSKRSRRRPSYRRKRKSLAVRPVQSRVAQLTKGVSFGFPPSMKNKLKYSQQINWGPMTAFTYGTNIFNANGLYDPDATGVGGQPRFYDQLTQLYSRWKVLATKVDMRIQQITTVEPCIAGVLFTTNTSFPFTTYNDLREYKQRPGSSSLLKYKHIQNVAGVSSKGAGSGTTISLYVPTWKSGKTTARAVMDLEEWAGIQLANPFNKIYCYTFVCPALETGIVATNVIADIDFTYYVKWSTLNNVGAS